jgi:cysteine synthase A
MTSESSLQKLALLDEIDKTIGNTPLIKISDKVWAKLETFNLTGSIKDRIVSFMLRKALENDEIPEDATLIEASSGNTGIALAAIGTALGYKVKIVMPQNMSAERKQMMRIFDAQIIEVGDSDFDAAILIREGMILAHSNYWSPRQFENENNILCHQLHLAEEINSELPDYWDAFIAGSGTGGTIMGVSNYLEENELETKLVLVTPEEDAKEHGIQGINDGADFLVWRSAIDEEIKISTHDAKERALQLAKENGLFVGISSGANVLAAERWVEKTGLGGVVVTILCDRGERYFHTFSPEVSNEV